MISTMTVLSAVIATIRGSAVHAEPGTPAKTTRTPEKDEEDLRDRAAFVHVTGAFPSHLRAYMNSLLRAVTRYGQGRAGLDGRTSSGFTVAADRISELGLEDHPMVRKARQYVREGYMIELLADPKARRPYSRVYLFKNESGVQKRLTVNLDGSVKEGWA